MLQPQKIVFAFSYFNQFLLLKASYQTKVPLFLCLFCSFSFCSFLPLFLFTLFLGSFVPVLSLCSSVVSLFLCSCVVPLSLCPLMNVQGPKFDLWRQTNNCLSERMKIEKPGVGWPILGQAKIHLSPACLITVTITMFMHEIISKLPGRVNFCGSLGQFGYPSPKSV